MKGSSTHFKTFPTIITIGRGTVKGGFGVQFSSLQLNITMQQQ
jgi:hypothetical protein